MKHILFFLAVIIQISIVSSQTTISGTIYDDFGPISDVYVVNINSNSSTISNSYGIFDLEVTLSDSILISRLGYQSKEIIIKNYSTKDIKLDIENAFDEIVIESNSLKPKESIINCDATLCRTFCCNVKGLEIETIYLSISKSNDLLLFPNPSQSGIFYLKLYEPSNSLTVQVVSVSGKKLLSEKHTAFNKKIKIDLSQFSNGIYFINIINNGKKLKTKRAIIAG